MKRTIKAALGAVPLLVLAHAASAGEPVQLSDQQMDGVTAAGSAFGQADATAVGGAVLTETAALAVVEVLAAASSEVTTIRVVGSLSTAQSLSLAN